MKSGTSSLNPYAAAYIPLSMRTTTREDGDCKLTGNDSGTGNETSKLGLDFEDGSWNHHQAPSEHMLRGKLIHGSYGSTSQRPKELEEKPILDEEFDMDLAYLQMTFPDISDESLAEVYLANKGDLEATLDMLTQLELNTDDSSEHLPDTLDIGDVVEHGSSGECAALLSMKKVADEIVGSSSGSS